MGQPRLASTRRREPRNILIFSDGTGQAGGLRPDQRLSNIYKLYRATRVDPDNDINPSDQVAFYDPGLGSEAEDSEIRGKWRRAVRKFASSATGAGIGHNITDCYEAILKHYEPGDRIFLFGFSRGAYTARSVAGVLRYCGVPTHGTDGGPIPRWGSALRAIAHEAVHRVYEHGSGRKRETFEPQREVLAERFRAKYGSDNAGAANVAPYFIGVFDTVAALGERGVMRWIMRLVLAVVAFVLISLVAVVISLFGPALRASFVYAGIGIGIVTALVLAKARIRVIWRYPSRSQFRWHWTGWKFKFYDTHLDHRVCFARHAMAIDETRADFARVPWGQPSEGDRPEVDGVESFVQLWFAGNHSDIGGSYPEDESRLSDIALGWMVEQIESLPHPVKIDRSKLHIWPDAGGMQHSEVEAFRDKYPSWFPVSWRLSWSEKPRRAAVGAPHHASVLERFRRDEVVDCQRVGPYRPSVLATDENYAPFYHRADTSSHSG